MMRHKVSQIKSIVRIADLDVVHKHTERDRQTDRQTDRQITFAIWRSFVSILRRDTKAFEASRHNGARVALHTEAFEAARHS